MTAPAWLWALRAVTVLTVLAPVMLLGRRVRTNRAALFRPRPSTAQGLAGHWTPTVSLVVPVPTGVVPAWVGGVAYPDAEILVAVPAGATARRVPPSAQIVVVGEPGLRAADERALVARAVDLASGEVVVVVPARVAVAPRFVERIVTALVDPFTGLAVGRVDAAGGRGFAARAWEVDLAARAAAQTGAFAVGGAVLCDGEPFAIRAELLDDVGGWDPDHPTPETDLSVRVYTRGFSVAYVEEARGASAFPGWYAVWRSTRDRVAGRRRIWRRVRRPLRRQNVLEGPEKTDVRWLLRGATAGLWVSAGWLAVLALRLADTSWVPEAVAGVLLALTFTTAVGSLPVPSVTAAAVTQRTPRLLAFLPWLLLLGLGALWTTTGAALTSPLRRRERRATDIVMVEERDERPAGGRRRRRRRPEAVVTSTAAGSSLEVPATPQRHDDAASLPDVTDVEPQEDRMPDIDEGFPGDEPVPSEDTDDHAEEPRRRRASAGGELLEGQEPTGPADAVADDGIERDVWDMDEEHDDVWDVGEEEDDVGDVGEEQDDRGDAAERPEDVSVEAEVPAGERQDTDDGWWSEDHEDALATEVADDDDGGPVASPVEERDEVRPKRRGPFGWLRRRGRPAVPPAPSDAPEPSAPTADVEDGSWLASLGASEEEEPPVDQGPVRPTDARSEPEAEREPQPEPELEAEPEPELEAEPEPEPGSEPEPEPGSEPEPEPGLEPEGKRRGERKRRERRGRARRSRDRDADDAAIWETWRPPGR